MLALFCTTSCNDWLEVKPKTEEEADKLFSTLDGFKSALAGVLHWYVPDRIVRA